MKTRNVLTISVVLLVLFSIGVAFAQEEAVPNQTKCPVMGGKINKEVFVDYNGKRVYFCCSGCDDKFLKEPAKFLDKMKADSVVLENAPITQEKCLVLGNPINKEIFTDYKGKRIYFCCKGCIKKFTDAPEKYLREKSK